MKFVTSKNGSSIETSTEIVKIKLETEEKVLLAVFVGASAFFGGIVLGAIVKQASAIALTNALQGSKVLLDIQFPQLGGDIDWFPTTPTNRV